jgi:hypothetical protein
VDWIKDAGLRNETTNKTLFDEENDIQKGVKENWTGLD